jgi:hypothetical protein
MKLPIHQVRQGQPRPAQWCMQPETQGMQGPLCGQARLPPAERMRPFPLAAPGGMAFLLDRRPKLADAREPAPPGLRPRPLAVAPGWAEDWGAGGRPPRRLVRLARKALGDALRTPGGSPDPGQPRRGRAAQGKPCRRPRWLLGAGCPTPQAGAHPDRGDGQQEGAPCSPAPPVPPAKVGLPRQPPGPPALGSAGRPPGAVAGCIGPALGRPEGDERQQKRHQGRVRPPDLPLGLLAGGPRRQGGPALARGGAVHAPRPAQALPRPAQGPGHHRAPAQGGLGARGRLGRQSSRAQVVHQNGKSRQEGVHIDQRSAPYLGEERAMLQAVGTFCVSSSCQLTPSVKQTTVVSPSPGKA